MKIFLSPAKRLDENPMVSWNSVTEPQFLSKAETIMKTLAKKSPKNLMEIMKISNDLAEMNYDRNQTWKKNPKDEESFLAGLMFDGEVYRSFRDAKFNEKELKYLQDNLYILSGLYGILRLTDKVMPYRLEMGTKMKIGKKENLYAFWKKTLTDFVNSQIEEDEILLDLASNEYLSAIDKKAIKGKWIDVKFKDYKNGKLMQIMVYFKQARGQMANFCAENHVKTIDELKKFDRMNYAYDDNLSDAKTLIFTR